MKHTLLMGLALLAAAASGARAQGSMPGATESMRLAVRPDSKLWIEGHSNLRDWSCEATALDASVDIDALSAADLESLATAPLQLRRVQVSVPVSGLTCGHGQMDRIMYRALKADSLPAARDIEGVFDVVPSEADGDYALRTVGTLRVAGRAKRVHLDVSLERREDGTMRAQGVLPIEMTDYGVTPPTALFGVIRTANQIVVKFDLLVDPRASMTALASSLDHR
ncbi:MAG TPA: YceI family protein [Gemmatimonadaceae bacterium]|nr:YceI family protein [Gemmatimonadaceae bacterium]